MTFEGAASSKWEKKRSEIHTAKDDGDLFLKAVKSDAQS